MGVFIQKVFITCISEISQYARNDIANALYKKGVYIYMTIMDILFDANTTESIHICVYEAGKRILQGVVFIPGFFFLCRYRKRLRLVKG